jgi:DNA-binding NarL/FixJ family response regulator
MDQGLTVMVVDQNEDVCERLARGLARQACIRVLAHTANLMLAAELAHQLSPDAILADFKLGGASRPETLRWLGRMSPRSLLVFHSSYYTEAERESFEAAGADLCLLKGMSSRDLGAEIRKLVRRRAMDEGQ